MKHIKIKKLNPDNLEAPKPAKDYLRVIQPLIFKHGWRILDYHKQGYILRIGRIKDRRKQSMNIYLSTWTVQTILNHPSKGKGQLNRRNVGYEELEKLLINPRTHTGKGYYQKYQKKKKK